MTDKPNDTAAMVHPSSRDFWPAKMKRDGDEATAEQMARAWDRWHMKSGCSGLAACLAVEAGIFQRTDFPMHEVAGAMIQRARKAGWIKMEITTWVPAKEAAQ